MIKIKQITEEQLDSLVETKFITPELKYYGASRPHQNLTEVQGTL